MRLLAAILFLFLANLSGCLNHSVPTENECPKTGATVLVDDIEADLMNLYNATAATRYAVQQESAACASGFCMRVLPYRTRTVSNTSTRQVLLSTHKPVVSKLMHHVINHLIAFPKEYHIFQLRRILI